MASCRQKFHRTHTRPPTFNSHDNDSAINCIRNERRGINAILKLTVRLFSRSSSLHPFVRPILFVLFLTWIIFSISGIFQMLWVFIYIFKSFININIIFILYSYKYCINLYHINIIHILYIININIIFGVWSLNYFDIATLLFLGEYIRKLKLLIEKAISHNRDSVT